MYLLTIGRAWQSKRLHRPIPCGFEGNAGGRHIATLEWSKSKLNLPKRELLGDFAMESRWRRCDHTCSLRRGEYCMFNVVPSKSERKCQGRMQKLATRIKQIFSTRPGSWYRRLRFVHMLPTGHRFCSRGQDGCYWITLCVGPISPHPSKVVVASLFAVRMSWHRLSTLACPPSVALRLPGARTG